MSVILANDLSVSYFTYKDEYWSIYYVKPYSRIPAFFIGAMAGSFYFSYKYEEPESSRFTSLMIRIKESNLVSVLCSLVGTTLMILMVAIM